MQRERELRAQLEEQKLEIERLQTSNDAHKLEREQLQQLGRDSYAEIFEMRKADLEAASILKGVLKGDSINLEGNVGGRLKSRIREALKLIDDI